MSDKGVRVCADCGASLEGKAACVRFCAEFVRRHKREHDRKYNELHRGMVTTSWGLTRRHEFKFATVQGGWRGQPRMGGSSARFVRR